MISIERERESKFWTNNEKPWIVVRVVMRARVCAQRKMGRKFPDRCGMDAWLWLGILRTRVLGERLALLLHNAKERVNCIPVFCKNFL